MKSYEVKVQIKGIKQNPLIDKIKEKHEASMQNVQRKKTTLFKSNSNN